MRAPGLPHQGQVVTHGRGNPRPGSVGAVTCYPNMHAPDPESFAALRSSTVYTVRMSNIIACAGRSHVIADDGSGLSVMSS